MSPLRTEFLANHSETTRDAAEVLLALIEAADAAPADMAVETIVAALRALGVQESAIYLLDYEQMYLQPMPDTTRKGAPLPGVPLLGSMAGRAFITQQVLSQDAEDGRRVWAPISPRGNRIGVLSLLITEEIVVPKVIPLVIGHILQAALQVSDRYQRVRRGQEMSLAAEMQWELLPPISYQGGGLSIAGALDSAYTIGGDSFDYAVDGEVANLVIADSMGHGLRATTLSSVAITAYRNARRGLGLTLTDFAVAMHHAVKETAQGEAFVTALFAQLNIKTGEFSWLAAGHSAPLIARGGSVLPEPEYVPGCILGIDGPLGEITTVRLEPDDRVLLYTDGVTESRNPAGEWFGQDRLEDLFARESQQNVTIAEQVLQLVREPLRFAEGVLQDDTTLLGLHWYPHEPPSAPKSASLGEDANALAKDA